MERPSSEVTEYYLYYVPQIAYLIMPIALLLATVFTTGGMARHLEIVAIRSLASIFLGLFAIDFFRTNGLWFRLLVK